METVALLYEDYQKELAEDFKNTFLKRASDTDSSRSNDTVIDEVTDMLSTNIAVYTEKLLQRWGFSSGGEGGAVALYQLLDVEKNSDITGVAGATKGNVLTFNGDKWYADKPKTAEGINRLFSALDADGNEVDLNDESKLGTITNIRANYALWSVDWISAKGKSSGGSGGGGGLISLVYGFESLGGTFDNNDNTATFNAFTINEIWKLASSGLTNVTVTGSGNAVTDVTKGSDGRSLTFTKGNTFASKSEFDALNTKFNDFLTGSDADDIINKWSELEVFLQGMKESDNLAVILQSKMDKSAFNKLFSALDSDGNEIDPSDNTKTVAAIRANFGFWGVDYVSAKGVSKGSGGTGGASALYQLVDVLANDAGDGVDGAAAGKALVFDGTHWKAADAGLNESQLSAFLSLNGYLTQTAADGRYVTSARKVIAGTGLSGGGSLTSDVTLSLGTSGVVAGTYTKVMVDVYGRVTSGTSLSATDIPSLDWSKITTGKPTTLAGYGITDAYSKTEADGKYVTIATAQTISGAKTFSAVTKTASVLPSADANSKLGGTANRWNNIYSVNGTFSQNVTAKLLSASETLQIGDAYLKWDSTNNAVYVIKKDGTTPVGFYSTDWLSAKGVSMSGVQTGTLADLTDVEITNPTNGQALKYDAISQKWVNGTIDSFNVNQMWTELTKADSSKVIDASHIPTSVLDNRWVKKAGDTMTGTLTSASTTGSIIFKGLENCDITNIYTNNGTLYSDTNLAIRNGLRFNWYDTYWYIGNLRGAGTNSSGFGIANESNKLCLQVTPDYTTAPVFRSSASQGTAPLIVYSTTQVSNLNADLLDDKHGAYYQNRVYDTFVSQYTQYDYIEFLRFVIPSGQNQLRAYVVFDLCRTETGNESSGRAVLRLRRNTDNTASTLFYVTNFGRSTLPELRCTSDDGITWRIWMKCNKSGHDPYIAVKIVEQYPYGYVTTQNNGTTGTPEGTRHVFTALSAGISNAANFLVNSRTLWGQPFNGTANVSGDMTGVGSINMSGVLTIKNSTYNKQLIIRSAGSTAKNQGEGIWFRCDDATQEVVLRHEWYDTFVPGYGLAVSKHDSLEAGDANMFFYNTGRFIAKAPQGTSPYQCVSTTVNANLNADLLDGLHENSFLRYRDAYGIDGYDTLWAQIGIRQYNNAKPDGMSSSPYLYGAVVSLPSSGARLDIWYNHLSSASDSPTNGIQYRSGWGNDRKPWRMLLDNVNYANYSDGRYVKKAGDTMTGDLTMNNTKGFNIGWSTRVVKTSSVWIHGGSDAASSTDANLRFGSWRGIGWYPTIDSTSGVRQGNNAMWLNVRNGNLDTHGAITAHNGYLAANWDSARRLVLGGGSYSWIGSRDSSNNVLCNIVLYDNKVYIGNYVESSRFVSTVGTGTAPYQCSSTTLNSNLNADMLDNWHLNFLPRNYNIGRCYAVKFALGSTDNNWRKIFACSESGTGPWQSVTVWGRIWYAYGNHAQSEVWNYHFCAIFYMRNGPSSSDSSVGNVENSARLFLPTFAKGMDNIRLVRVGTNNFELQVRQISSYHNANIEYQYWANGANVSAWENLQSTSNTSVAVSAGGASTLADSRASSADVWTTARTFYIQDYHSANTGAGVSVNGGSNCYLKLPSTTRFSRIDFSTPNANIRHSGNDNGNEVGSSTLSNLVIDSWYGVSFTTTCSSKYQNKIAMSVNCHTGRVTADNFHAATNITANGAITAKASSSDIRLKTDIQGYDAMGIIRKFRSVKYHWNAIAKENSEVFNHDNWNYGLIAQDLLSGGYSQWVKDIFNDYYTIDYERLIPVVWKGLQEVDDEVTKLKKEVARLNKRVKELEKSLCA